MSKIDNIVGLTKRILNINFTNNELIQIMSNESVSEYMNKLSTCFEKYNQDDQKFFNCAINSACPEQTESFIKCQKENKKNLSVCAPNLMHIEDCMRLNNNRILEVLNKAKIF
jgi:hypothetical protein